MSCLVAGFLTLHHCFILPKTETLNPIAMVPSSLYNETTRASINALVCWSQDSHAATFNKFLEDEAKESTGVELAQRSAQAFLGVPFSSMMSPWIPLGML